MGGLLAKFRMSETSHCLIDRNTGRKIAEPEPTTKAVRCFLLYDTWLGHLLLELPAFWMVLTWEHRRLAKWANSPDSKKSIPSFIKTYQIDVGEAEKPVEEYDTMQAFFTRRVKPERRPMAAANDPAVAVHLGDSRVVVYDFVEQAHRLWVKGRHFTIQNLLGPDYNADHWRHASVVINRLSPSDCHRLHATVGGRVAAISRQGRRYMASLWVAVHSNIDVLTENERLVMEFDSPEFGTVVQVMVGASDVGTVQPLVEVGQEVKKGDEVGVFQFGGSICITLFPNGSIEFDPDLKANTADMCETRCQMLGSLGRATGVKNSRARAPAGHP